MNSLWPEFYLLSIETSKELNAFSANCRKALRIYMYMHMSTCYNNCHVRKDTLLIAGTMDSSRRCRGREGPGEQVPKSPHIPSSDMQLQINRTGVNSKHQFPPVLESALKGKNRLHMIGFHSTSFNFKTNLTHGKFLAWSWKILLYDSNGMVQYIQ